MKKRLILCFLAAALVFNVVASVNIASAAVSSTFDILFEKKGESFSVDVIGKNIKNMFACEVHLTFDNKLLDCVDIATGIKGQIIAPEVGENDNKILFAMAKSNNQSPENGNVTLCTITFTGRKEGKAKVTLDTVRQMDEILKATDYSVGKTIEIPAAAGVSSNLTQGDGLTEMPITTINIPRDIIPFDSATGVARVDLGKEAADIFSGKGITVVNVPPIPETKAYTLEIPADSLSGALGGGLLKFSTGIGGITISGNMLEGIPQTRGKAIGITIGNGDKSVLPDNLKKTIGDRPLVQLTLTLDGVQAGWSNPNAPVTVSIPYTPTAKEKADPEHIVVWYIDSKGNTVSIPNGRFDSKTGMVTFTATHFSYYAITYVNKTFSDLAGVPWAKKSIETMASKGIIAGTGGGAYSPNLKITRADYLSLLVRTLGLWAKVEDNFDDVKTNAYYYESVGIARKLGITMGVGNNRFLPREPITRQDMMVLTAKAMKIAGKLNSKGNPAVLSGFTDKTRIASYAVGSVAALVETGLIKGSNKRINPLANTTRAEAAVVMYGIYNK